MMTTIVRICALTAALALLLPGAAAALSFESDFKDLGADWLLESGSDAVQKADSVDLMAAAISPKERGRILTRPILAATPEEVLNLVFTVQASEVTAPLAARIFYYDAARNYLDSDPLFGTLSAGTVVTLGTVLTPHVDTAGIRLRLYANSPEGKVTFEHVAIESSIVPTPEPGTAVLMGLGLGGLTVFGSRKRARA